MMLNASANAQDAVELELCANIEDPQARLACRDTASQGNQAAKPATSPLEAAPARESLESHAPEQSAPPLDAVGEEQPGFRGEKEESLRFLLKECRKGPTGKSYFYFDNCQVWKQSDNDRFSISSGEVTISKDFCGYKIRFADPDKKIRAARVR